MAATPAMAGEELQIGPAPDWVEAVAQLPGATDGNELPARLVLMDSQVRFEEGGQSNYTDLAIKFQTPEGLAGGNLTFAWRPETQDLTIHKVLIHRGDETIDVLASGQTFTVLRREQNLEMAMLDGTLTATMFPEGLQVGDVLEFASTVTDRDPVTAGHAEVAVGPLNFPVDRLNVKVEWPLGRQVNLAQTKDLPAWRRSRKDGVETVEFSLEDIEPVATPRLAPIRYNMIRFAEATEYRSWADVAALQIPLYAKAAKVPATGPLRVEVERIREASPDPVARAEAALKLVQGRIRYVALAMGSGGLVPTDAEQTWARRYGDCKAKTALLLAILGELGIEAQGVAVSVDAGDIVSKRIPSIGAFNHILVRAKIGGRDYWLDGTRTGDTGLARLQVPDFSWGLPIVEHAELVRMVPAPLAEPASDLAIQMDASKGVHSPVPTHIELTYRGDTALGVNQDMANFVGDARDRTLREFWRRRFNFITPEKVAMKFDESTQQLLLTLEGQAALDWNGAFYETDETGLGFKADFSREAGPAKDAPFAVGHPFYTRTRQTIILPPGFAGPTSQDVNVNEVVAGVEYKRATTFSGDRLVIEASQRSIETEFAAADAPRFQKRLRELADNAVYLRIPNNYVPTAADLQASLDDTSGDSDDLVARASLLMNANKADEALALLDRATDLDEGDVWAWANRGIALIDLKRPDEAAASLDKAEAIDPRNRVLLNARGRLAESSRDWQGAVDAYTKALEADSTNEFARTHRANMYLGLQKPELALDDAAIALKANPKLTLMYRLRIFLLTRWGRKEEAADQIETMLAALPDDPYVLGLAIDSYNELEMREKAQALAANALEGEPSALLYFNLSRGRDPADTEARLSDLNNALRLDPKFGPALMARANLQFSERRYDEALADTDAMQKLEVVPPEVNVLRANIFTRMDRKDDAIAEATAVVTAHPDEPWAYAAAGKIYSHFKMRAEAVAALDRAIAMEPNGGYYLDRSQVREPTDWEGRLADIDAQLQRMPNDMNALFTKAEVLNEREDYSGAAEVYSLVLKTQAPSPEVLNSRGMALWRSGRREEAEVDLARARELAKDANVLNGICYAKAVANVALDRALEECEASLQLKPDFAPILDSRGTVLLRLGRLDEAIRDFDRALEQVPNMGQSRYLRAVARSKQGDAAGAAKDLELVRRDSPMLIAEMERLGFAVVGDE
ncbi:hypothetical protein ASD76_00480 [Altererythrobacter sp. Root672]|nr:hypothetical protein ASD76_00480 [Altererythrobacter sp. Root672]